MLNSTILGSIITNLSSDGCFLYSRDVIIAFSPTDFPIPVAPATSICGIFVRSAMNTSFDMVHPIAIGNLYLHSWNFFDSIIERIDTVCLSLLGTSIPMVPLPGIGAIIRIPNAARLRAMSSSNTLIFEILTPSAGIISYKVTVGPTLTLMLLISIP